MAKETTADIEKKIADAAEKLKQDRNRLKQLQARKTAISRKDRTRKLIVIGAVIAAKADQEEEFKSRLMQWLDESVTAERDRALFDLLPQTSKPPPLLSKPEPSSELQPDLPQPPPKT